MIGALYTWGPIFVRAAEEEEEHVSTDDKGIVTHSPLWPEGYELLWFSIAFLIVFALLYKLAWPAIKKGLAARTDRIAKELDEASAQSSAAEAEAARIRQALGDIDAERERILAEADRQAAAVLEEGRARLAQEVREVEARGQADIAAARSRAGNELRAEIARLSSEAIERVVARALDGATHQQLVENFISRVGAGAQP